MSQYSYIQSACPEGRTGVRVVVDYARLVEENLLFMSKQTHNELEVQGSLDEIHQVLVRCIQVPYDGAVST